MNKKITLSVSLSLFAVLLCGAIIYAVYNSGRDKGSIDFSAGRGTSETPAWIADMFTQSKAYDLALEDDMDFINQGRKGTVRTLSYQGREITLAYRSTMNNTHDDTMYHARMRPSERADNYGIYDEYVDERGNEYDFIYDTDILCSVLNFARTTDSETRIDKERAVEIARKYLSSIFSENTFNTYVLDYCILSDSVGAGYGVCFYKPLGGYKTDDEIYVSMATDGSIEYFSAWNLLRYSRFQDVAGKIDGEKNRTEFLAAFEASPAGQFKGTKEIHDGIITLNDKGELAFYYDVVLVANNGPRSMERYWQPIDLG